MLPTCLPQMLGSLTLGLLLLLPLQSWPPLLLQGALPQHCWQYHIVLLLAPLAVCPSLPHQHSLHTLRWDPLQ